MNVLPEFFTPKILFLGWGEGAECVLNVIFRGETPPKKNPELAKLFWTANSDPARCIESYCQHEKYNFKRYWLDADLCWLLNVSVGQTPPLRISTGHWDYY